jgi:succinate dehydrogenase hydrophobic anchor subunit
VIIRVEGLNIDVIVAGNRSISTYMKWHQREHGIILLVPMISKVFLMIHHKNNKYQNIVLETDLCDYKYSHFMLEFLYQKLY